MLKRNYIVKRDEIYFGELVKPIEFSVYMDDYKIDGKDVSGEIALRCYQPLRNLLFTINENNCASDLLSIVTDYPIIGRTKENIVTSSDIIVNDYQNLDILLSRLGFCEELNYQDLKQIRKQIFNYDFIKENYDMLSESEAMKKILYAFRIVGNYRDREFGGAYPFKKDPFKPTLDEYKRLLKIK